MFGVSGLLNGRMKENSPPPTPSGKSISLGQQWHSQGAALLLLGLEPEHFQGRR